MRPALVLILVLVLVLDALAGAFEDARAAFEQAWKGEDYQAKVAAIERLLDTGDLRALQLVVERALVCEDQFVYERALEHVAAKATPEGRAWIASQATKHASKEVRVVLVRLCGGLDTPGAPDAIALALRDKEWTVQVAAIRAARERRAKSFIAALIAVVAASDGRVREDAVAALRDLTGADYGRDAKQWEGWWAGAEAGFAVKPPASEEAQRAEREKKTDVGTVSRDGLYEIRSKRTLFVVDLSASMEARTEKGTRLEVVKKEIERAVSDLGDTVSFNVIFFSDKAQLWKPRMVKASDGNRSGAVRLVKAQKPNGMTASHEALKLALSQDDVDTVIFLSDGFPTAGKVTSEEVIKSDVRKWNRTKGITIHTIAFVAGTLKGESEDKERAKDFMRELAAENGGTCKIVE